MSGYTGQENYWGQSPQSHYNFDSSGFDQPNQQFEFQTYNDQQAGDYSYAQKGYPVLDPVQNTFAGGTYRKNSFKTDFNQDILCRFK